MKKNISSIIWLAVTAIGALGAVMVIAVNWFSLFHALIAFPAILIFVWEIHINFISKKKKDTV